MSLSLSGVLQAWASSLAELQEVPKDKLQLLLSTTRVDGSGHAAPKDAGEVLQEALPLAKYLGKSSGQHAEQVVPQLTKALAHVPQVWTAVQSNPLQTQAGFAQLMLDLRRVARSTSLPLTAQQQLSAAVYQLLQQLLQTAAQKQASHLDTWVECGCNLLLRALTRSEEFKQDPILPMQPDDAHKTLTWVYEQVISLASSTVGSSVNGTTPLKQGGVQADLLLKDDKFYLLLSQLVMTAFQTSCWEAAATPYSSTSRGGAAEPVPNGKNVTWADGPAATAAAQSAGDPALLCWLVEWSTSRVKLALQVLLQPVGDLNAAPSREATTACALLAVTCIHTLQAGPSLSASLAEVLSKQMEDLLGTAIAVGEAAVASAAATEHNADSDKVLVLAARILSNAVPFVAAAGQHSTQDHRFALTGRLQQLMVAAARLAGSHGVQMQQQIGDSRWESFKGSKYRYQTDKNTQHLQATSGSTTHGAAAYGTQPQPAGAAVKCLEAVPEQPVVLELEQDLSAEDRLHPWFWNVTEPLTTLSSGVKLSQLPLSCGAGGFLLARAAAEMLCEALAESWLPGTSAPLRRLLLLPQGGPAGQVVGALAMGRLYVKLQAHEIIGKLLLPVVADILTGISSSNRPTTGTACPTTVNSSVAVKRTASSGAGSAVAAQYTAGLLGATGGAEVAGAVVCALEGMACACVQYKGDAWLYDQVLQLLLMMYREPTKLSHQLLAGNAAHPATTGLLANTLHRLAIGLSDAPQQARHDLRMKLLVLYSDVAAGVGGSSGVVAANLGDLLVVVAATAEGLQPRTLRLLGGSSNSRMSMPDIQSAQREDASTTRLFRNLWLYTAVHKLVNPIAGLAAAVTAASGSSAQAGTAAWATGTPGQCRGGVAEWQAAAGRLAAVTPLLVVGTDSYYEADMVERLKVELGDQLSQVGSLASKSSLMVSLTSLLGGRAAALYSVSDLPKPREPGLLAFILAVALAELSRATLAPFPDLGDDPVVSCPISITMGYLKGVLPDGVAAAWLGAIVRRATALYINRLLDLAARQEQEEEEEGATMHGAAAAGALAYAEQLACALIANLNTGSGFAAVTEGSMASSPVLAVGKLANELLGKLVAAFPALYHSQACYCALLVQLQQEEGDVPMGKVRPPPQGLIWERTKAWIESAAAAAPMTTEALLHSFLTSSKSLPGATSPAWLAGESIGGAEYAHDFAATSTRGTRGLARRGSLTKGSRVAGQSSKDVLPNGVQGLGNKQQHVATQAAFRRAADLLQACEAAKKRQQLWSVGDGEYEGALGLTRKLHYTGYVQGLVNGCGSAAAPAAMLTGAQESRRGSSAGAGSSANLTIVGSADGQFAEAMEGPQRSASGLTVYKSVGVADDDFLSVVDGAVDADDVADDRVQLAVAEEIAAQLDLALQQPAMHAPQMAMALLNATALLAVQPDAFSSSRLGSKLLSALARAPLKHLTPETVRLAQFSWCWVCVESPGVFVPLISSLTCTWIWTVDQRLGMFSGRQQQLGSESTHATGAGHVVADTSEAKASGAMLQAIAAHFLWLSHLLETWVVVSRLRDSRTAAARALFGRLLAASLQDPTALSHHPAAVGAYFRLLTLGLVFARSSMGMQLGEGARAQIGAGQDVLLLFDRIIQAALFWFRSPPRYFAKCTRHAAVEQVAALETFIAELSVLVSEAKAAGWQSFPTYNALIAAGNQSEAATAAARHPVWGIAYPNVPGYIALLDFLCKEEVLRLRVWTEPLKYADAYRTTPSVPWRDFVSTAWQVDPALALSLRDHFPALADVHTALETLVVKHCHEPQVQSLPKAALLLATTKCHKQQELLRYLTIWTPGTAAQGLQLLSGPAGNLLAVRSYAVRCLFNEAPEKLVFFLPQLVQLLRGDADGAISRFFLTAASGSDLFGHQLIWALNSEAKPPEEAFNPEVKRSGWQPPKDTGLWDIAVSVKQQLEQQMTPVQREYWEAEGGYFEKVTSLSGYLYKFAKDERRLRLQEALAQFQPPRQDLYIPTNPEARVLGHIPSSGACMQSAAKVPILVAFDVEVPAPGASTTTGPRVPAKMACIFKVGDDIRQDVLAIQVIRLLHEAFTDAGLSLYLRPYGCLPTGYECGIIEVVPNTKSRAALGELSDRGLHDIFTAEFGAPGSPAFETARENFIVSEAAYAVASYLLQAKDRHNGNIMLDDQGHIVHIDFGFILEISPGGNLGFESAAFKLSHEMAQVLDPGGRRVSPQLALFEELVIRAYLAARTVAEPIIATVSLMADSGLPCFSRGQPIANLRQRFHLEMNDGQAAAFMRQQIADAYDKWTTGFYDYIQSLQNKIPY